MLTRWGKAVQPDSVLAEYPRPQMVRDGWQNLNGLWRYAITPLRAGQPQAWGGDILVPFCVESPLSGVGRRVSPEQRIWYQRSFSLEAADSRTLLHFGAVDYECAVWVNGALAGAHQGGFDPFTLDITDYVDAGDNELVLAVRDPSSRGEQPRGKQHLNPQGIWYTPVSGIWQTVWLEQVPLAQHIAELRMVPTDGCDGIVFTAFLNRPSRSPELMVGVDIRLGDRLVSQVVVPPDRRTVIEVPDAELWSPDQPILYDVEVTLYHGQSPLPESDGRERGLNRAHPLRGGHEARRFAQAKLDSAEPLDQVSGYFGLRRISVGPHPEGGHPTLLLNDEPLFQLGTLDQGWWPDGLHTPPADEAMVFEIEYLKAAGFNTLRKHIKVEPARYYYHCDRLGILVWQDMPSGFLPAQFVAPNDEDEALRSSPASEQFELELSRMINRLGVHPSIVTWVLHNEGWGQAETGRLTGKIRGMDSTRLVNATSGWLDVGVGDFIDRHDYQAEPDGPEPDGRRVLVLGEYGGIGWPIEAHLWNPELRNWGYQTLHGEANVRAAYSNATAAIVSLARARGLSGAIYTQTTDVEGEVNGLLTYDREVAKLPADWLRGVHEPLTG